MNTVARLTRAAMTALILCLAIAGGAQSQAAHGMGDHDAESDAIREVIQTAYIAGIHLNGSRADIRSGFHPSFVMTVLSDGETIAVSIEDWIARLPAEGTAVDRNVTAEIPSVDRTDDTAVARVEVTIDGTHVYTDYMGLYRFPEGWRIVNKIFHTHEG